jgi:hypothetical protein
VARKKKPSIPDLGPISVTLPTPKVMTARERLEQQLDLENEQLRETFRKRRAAWRDVRSRPVLVPDQTILEALKHVHGVKKRLFELRERITQHNQALRDLKKKLRAA